MTACWLCLFLSSAKHKHVQREPQTAATCMVDLAPCTFVCQPFEDLFSDKAPGSISLPCLLFVLNSYGC